MCNCTRSGGESDLHWHECSLRQQRVVALKVEENEGNLTSEDAWESHGRVCLEKKFGEGEIDDVRVKRYSLLGSSVL